MVLDGDFEAQLYHRLNLTSELDKTFTLQILKSNRFAVFQTHLDYLRAGAQIIRTNTSRASLDSFRIHSYLSLHEYLQMIEVASKLAKQAVFKYYEEIGGDSSNVRLYQLNRPLMAGSCSGYSSTIFANAANPLAEIEQMSAKELWWFYKHRIDALMRTNVDLLTFDSISTMKEAKAIIETLRSYPQARALITFLCSQEAKLLDGNTFKKAATYCFTSLPKQFIAIGPEYFNSDLIMPLIRKTNSRRSNKIPFLTYANKSLFPITEVQRNFVQGWIDNGVRYIGGGNGTIAEDIKEIRKQVDYYRYSNYEYFSL